MDRCARRSSIFFQYTGMPVYDLKTQKPSYPLYKTVGPGPGARTDRIFRRASSVSGHRKSPLSTRLTVEPVRTDAVTRIAPRASGRSADPESETNAAPGARSTPSELPGPAEVSGGIRKPIAENFSPEAAAPLYQKTRRFRFRTEPEPAESVTTSPGILWEPRPTIACIESKENAV